MSYLVIAATILKKMAVD